MIQQPLFQDYLEPERLKKGEDKCPCCGKLMRAYKKTIDIRLVKMLYEILVHTQGKTLSVWNPREVFKGDHHKINDFQKLHYFGIIKRSDKTAGYWKITNNGRQFLLGNIRLPQYVWVFNNEVIEKADDMINIKTVDERWQEVRADWSYDFMPYNYNTDV